MMIESSCLTLEVSSPIESEIVFLPAHVQLDLGKDRSTGLTTVLRAGRSSNAPSHDIEAGGGSEEAVNRGDMLLAVTCADGTLTFVDSAKAGLAMLREAQERAGPDGLVEVRVARTGEPCPTPARMHSAPLESKMATRSVALSAVRRAGHGDASGRTSPTNSEVGDSYSSDGEGGGGGRDGGGRQDAGGNAWRSMEQRRRRNSPVERPSTVDSLAIMTPSMLKVGF